MRFIVRSDSIYFVTRPIFHKALETGVQRLCKNEGIDLYWRFRTRGDHAGLTFFVEFFGWLFEFNIHDERHWDYEKNTWASTADETDAEYEAAKLGHFEE